MGELHSLTQDLHTQLYEASCALGGLIHLVEAMDNTPIQLQPMELMMLLIPVHDRLQAALATGWPRQAVA